MFKFFKKVYKSADNLVGIKEYNENENPFEEGPCLVCLSAVDGHAKSIFGFVKVAAKTARICVNGDVGAKFSIEDIPFSICALRNVVDPKIEEKKLTEEENEKNFVDKYIEPLMLDENGTVNTKEEAMRKLRNVNFMSNCDGTHRGIGIVKHIENKLNELGYKEEEIPEILSQVTLLPFQTEVDLSECKASIIDFHNTNDCEVICNDSNITEEMLNENSKSNIKETVHIADNRMEVLIAGDYSHLLSNYIRKGEAMPVIVHSVVTSIMENAVRNHTGKQLEKLSIEDLYSKAKNIVDRVSSGEKKQDLISELDEKVDYGDGINKLSDREIELLDRNQKLAKEMLSREYEQEGTKYYLDRANKKIETMLEVAKSRGSESTYLSVLEASGYQLTDEKRNQISEKTDKEIIAEQGETIEKQEEKINKLQKMLGRTLKFAEKVKHSVFGKIFFGKDIKGLPEPDDSKDER